eukprot:CAMPEP_0178416808 /NCGR_PEP_ID=MMETSP0689_2-20121128/24253_1 /TAXON_ID=160604 /ORGANISM="Amphidinium massartii, Strain CS-259" /LENGTH=385 /DNA_ID=CAMNT_0020038161 /DNA_START=88 /DNA_END=1241 /DNA_ORIENTATION=-
MGCGASTSQKKVAPCGAEGHDPEQAAQQREDIRDRYEIGRILGSGSFGQVREAVLKDDDSSEIRAVKVIERDNDSGVWSSWAIFMREIELLQEITHKNIIRYYDFYEDPHFLYVVMELCRGGEIFAKILELKRFREKDAAQLGQQMLCAIAYIHEHRIVHRDIKAENFMLSESGIDSPVKMIDFGMATKLKQDEVLTELCGSPHYLAPELIGQKYTHLVDIWAFGVLMYLLMYGQYPYDAKSPKDIMSRILTQPISWQRGKAKLSQAAIAFLKQLLVHDPKQRPEASAALEQNWLHPAADGETAVEQEQDIPSEVLRSAHRKATATKKPVAQRAERQRNKKLTKLQDDFAKGIRHGKRLGSTQLQEFMQKPEYIRRENKLATAPG